MYEQSIILFDGVCNLCNAFIQFVIKRDQADQFIFASLQSEEGKKILEKNNNANTLYSFILVENGKVYDRSTAVLRVSRKLKGLWPLLYGFIYLPKFIRDRVYNFIAKNRYQWFGRKNVCMTPTPGLKAKFLNQ